MLRFVWIVLGGLALLGGVTAQTVTLVEPAAVMLAGTRVLDVRPDLTEYLAGHLPNAVNLVDSQLRGPKNGVPAQFVSPALLGELFARAGVRDGQRVVLYAEGTNVLGATAIAYLLQKVGHPDVAILNGGWSAYAGQPVSQAYPTDLPGVFTVREHPEIAATLADVQAPGVTLLDVRPLPAYTGQAPAGLRSGHIPGARNLDWRQLVAADNPHRFKSPAEMQAAFEAIGVKKTDDVIVYCQTGRQASLAFIVLHDLLGYPRVRLYEGSWTEYSAHPELPIATGPAPG